MNQAASSVADRNELPEQYRMKDFYRQERVGTRDLTLGKKVD